MRENVVEKYFVEQVERRNGVAIKLGRNGWQDRLAVLPGPRIGLCELKRPGAVPRSLQRERLRELEALGVVCGWASTHLEVDQFIGRLLQ